MTIEILKSIINKYDPIHLIKAGAPEDEYDLEISKIFNLIKEKSFTENNLVQGIKDIFISSFDKQIVLDSGMDTYISIAKEILEKQ